EPADAARDTLLDRSLLEAGDLEQQRCDDDRLAAVALGVELERLRDLLDEPLVAVQQLGLAVAGDPRAAGDRGVDGDAELVEGLAQPPAPQPRRPPARRGGRR